MVDGAEDNQFGFAPHIDTNFLTLLAQSALPGLEVRTAQGEWIRPISIPGSFVVNTGEMLGRYSNDRYIATPHRVINRSGADRYSIPYFCNPRWDAPIKPLMGKTDDAEAGELYEVYQRNSWRRIFPIANIPE